MQMKQHLRLLDATLDSQLDSVATKRHVKDVSAWNNKDRDYDTTFFPANPALPLTSQYIKNPLV